MSKKKLLVILGAGSSISCGMPSVNTINDQMKIWSRDWESLPGFPKGEVGDGLFNEVWTMLEQYYLRNPHQHLGMSVNFEKVLGEMLAIASWVTPSPFGNTISEMIKDKNVSEKLTLPKKGEENFFQRHMVIDQLKNLLENLTGYMRQKARDLDTNSQSFQNYKKIFDELRDEFDLGVYNLNYDNVAITAWPKAFNGFNEYGFDAKAIGNRNHWGFIYHLHGSVHNSFTGPNKQSVIWKENLESEKEFCNYSFITPETTSDFKPIPSSVLIAGGFKLDQLLADPFQSFYSSLVRHAHEADAVLIGGYGFGDVHVNRALKNRFYSKLQPRDRPPTIVLTKTFKKMIAIGQRHDLATHELTRTLNTRFKDNSPVCFNIEEMDGKVFEPDFFNRVKVWHGGFTEAVECVDMIAAHLISD